MAGLILAALSGCERSAPPTSSAEPRVADNQQVENRGADKDRWWEALPRPAWSRFERVRLDADQGWFEVYRVAPGVTAIYEPGQFEEVISYLIAGSERALLFDTGLGIGDIRAVVEALTELPITVINSHTHYDHIGGNHQFEHVLATDTDYSAARSGGLGHDQVAEFVGEGWIWKPTPPGFDRATYRSRPFAIGATVAGGEQIELGGRTLEVLLTPGHAPDSLCLLDRANRLLFTGDTFYPAPLYTHLEGSDLNDYAASARRLGGLAGAVDQVLPAHNEPVVGPEYLTRMADAFDTIVSGEGEFIVTDGNREYRFEGFSVIVDPTALVRD